MGFIEIYYSTGEGEKAKGYHYRFLSKWFSCGSNEGTLVATGGNDSLGTADFLNGTWDTGIGGKKANRTIGKTMGCDPLD